MKHDPREFVLVLATSPGATGGIERATRALVRALSELYGSARVGLLAVWATDQEPELPCRVLRRAPRRPGDETRVGSLNKLSYAASALYWALRYRRRLSIICCHPWLSPLARAAAFIGRAEYAVWAHGTDAWFSLKGSERRALAAATLMFAPSAYTARRMEEQAGSPPGTARVVPYPLGEGLVETQPAPGSVSQGSFVLTVGRLSDMERRKGVDDVIRAMPKVLDSVPGIRLVVIGDGSQRPELERLAREVGVDGDVVFAGALSDAETLAAYRDCEFLVMPSGQEGFGLVYIEAASFGKPSIAAMYGGAPEAVVDGETGFVVPFRDEEQIATKMIELLSDAELRDELGEKARKRAEKRHSFDTFTRNISEIVGALNGKSAERGWPQQRNRDWWQQHPMSYDWHRTLDSSEGSPEFFREVDRRLFESSPFYRGARPFDSLIPFDRLAGKRVLEIGCGLGSHAQLFCEAGCDYTGIDITDRAVEMTQRRLELAGLRGNVSLMDAEKMEFADESLDFIWAWGVIHHSSDPEAILGEANRVLAPGGEIRVMVYHVRSLNAWYFVARGALAGRLFRGMSTRDLVSHYSDGYVARSYTARELSRLLSSAGFEDVRTSVCGQTAELYPLPGTGPLGVVKRALLAATPDALARPFLSRLGFFLSASGRKDG